MSREHREAAMHAVLTEAARQDALHGADRNLTPAQWYPILGEEFGEVGTAIQNVDLVQFGIECAHVAAVALQTLEWIVRQYPQAGQKVAERIAQDLENATGLLVPVPSEAPDGSN